MQHPVLLVLTKCQYGAGLFFNFIFIIDVVTDAPLPSHIAHHTVVCV